MATLWALLLIAAGLASIASSWLVYRVETKNRPQGFWAQAEIVQAGSGSSKGQFELLLAFYHKNKAFKLQRVFGEEAEYLTAGRSVPIIYDPIGDQLYLRPGKRYQKIQSGLIALGMVLSMAGAFVAVFDGSLG